MGRDVFGVGQGEKSPWPFANAHGAVARARVRFRKMRVLPLEMRVLSTETRVLFPEMRGVIAPAEVLVTSVVALGDGTARISFNLPVTLNEFGPEGTIRFVVGGVTGYAEDLSQDGPDAIVAMSYDVSIVAGCAWAILAVPPCFVLPPDAAMPVPQAGIVE